MLDWLLDPWTSGIMRRALADVVLTGASCGALGCFVMLRGMAFLGEGMAHTIVFGVVLAFVLGVSTALGAAVVAVLTLVLATGIAADRRFGFDTAMGILLPSLFGAGVVVANLSEGYRARLEDALFGSILGVSTGDVALAVAVLAVTTALLLVAGKELVLASFDRPMAAAMGYRVRLLDLVLLAGVTFAAVVALRAVGNVLLTALLLGPALTARLLCARFWPMAACAAALAAGCGVAGLYLTWYLNIGGGAAIVMVITAVFLVVAAGTRIRARASRLPSRRAGAMRYGAES